MASRLLLPFVAVPLIALAVAGCGGSDGKSIADVKTCLKDAKLTVESAAKNDKDVKEGVSGTTDLTDPDKMVLAVAALAKSEDKVKDFEKQSKELSKQLTAQEDAKDKMDIKSGSDGTYVWVVAGAKDSKKFDEVLECVQP